MPALRLLALGLLLALEPASCQEGKSSIPGETEARGVGVAFGTGELLRNGKNASVPPAALPSYVSSVVDLAADGTVFTCLA